MWLFVVVDNMKVILTYLRLRLILKNGGKSYIIVESTFLSTEGEGLKT